MLLFHATVFHVIQIIDFMFHLYTQKIIYFNSILCRLEKISFKQIKYNYEFNIIRTIAVNNNFNTNTIKKIHNKTKK